MINALHPELFLRQHAAETARLVSRTERRRQRLARARRVDADRTTR